MDQILETPRLRLLPLAHADVDTLHRQWTDPDVRRYLWDGVIISRERVAEVIEASIASFATLRFGFWLLRTRDDDMPVGFAGLRPIEGGEGVELFYGLEPAQWGKGLATEASRAVLRHGFDTGLDRIWIRTDGPNTASITVMHRLGATYVRTDPTGAFGSTISYAISRTT